jgi:hypothetical protein
LRAPSRDGAGELAAELLLSLSRASLAKLDRSRTLNG